MNPSFAVVDYAPLIVYWRPPVDLTDEQFFEFCRHETTIQGERGLRLTDLVVIAGRELLKDGEQAKSVQQLIRSSPCRPSRARQGILQDRLFSVQREFRSGDPLPKQRRRSGPLHSGVGAAGSHG
jgi:hypothetical protein